MTKHSMTQHNEVTEMFLQLPGFFVQMYVQHYQTDGEFVADIPGIQVTEIPHQLSKFLTY